MIKTNICTPKNINKIDRYGINREFERISFCVIIPYWNRNIFLFLKTFATFLQFSKNSSIIRISYKMRIMSNENLLWKKIIQFGWNVSKKSQNYYALFFEVYMFYFGRSGIGNIKAHYSKTVVPIWFIFSQQTVIKSLLFRKTYNRT